MSSTNQAKPVPLHTPGPWHYCPGEDGKPITDDTIAIAYMDAYQPDEDDEGFWEMENHANARLIAAAPELLEQLKLLVRWAENQNNDCRYARDVIGRATIEPSEWRAA